MLIQEMSKNEKITFDYRKFNPNFHHLKKALKDDDIRFIFLIGGSSSSKSFSVAQAILLFCLSDGYNTRVYRKTGATIADSIYKAFKEAANSLGISKAFDFRENAIKCFNGSYITFSGLDDPEKIKGLESYQFVVCEELSDFAEADFKQIKKRLRGRLGQKIISMFNPISEEHWIKKNVFDKEDLHEVDNYLYGIKNTLTGDVLPKEYTTITKKLINSPRIITNPRTGEEEVHAPDTLILKSTYLNNFWVVGSPDGTYGFYDRQAVADFEKDKNRDYNYYRIYALGDWGSIRTGGEYLYAFDAGKHRGNYPYDSKTPIHISVDNNVLPYITVTLWQKNDNNFRQIHEICAEDPNNTVTQAASMTRDWLTSIGYADVLFVHGDATTRSGNTIDDEKRSFLDKFIECLEQRFVVNDCVPASNPSVALSGEFINAILSGNLYGINIGIDDSCKKSIRDYENVKKDANGAILKQRIKNKETGQSYEEFGHCTDTFRYVVVDVFKDEYTRFSLKRKRSVQSEDDVLYFNADAAGSELLYVIPDNFGMMTAVSCVIHDYIDIKDVVYHGCYDSDMLFRCVENANGLVIFECEKAFFHTVRELRELREIKVISSSSDYKLRIEANKDFIRKKVRFSGGYESNADYLLFMNDFLDYNGKDSASAINIISAMSKYIRKNFF